MEILSVNIGKPVFIEWRGQKVETGIYKYPVNEAIRLEKEDVVNDHVIDRRYHGGVDKACYLYSSDHYIFWKNRYPNLEWNWGIFGENLTIKGLNESEVRIGDYFAIGSAVVQVTQPRQPCYKLGIRFGDPNVVSDFWTLPYPGVYVRVITPGDVNAGDHVNLLETNPESLTVADVFSLFRMNRENLGLIRQALAEPYLAASCRRDIEKLLNGAG